MEKNLINAVRYIIKNCTGLRPRENVLLIYDQTTVGLVPLFQKEICYYTQDCTISHIPISKVHGEEPPADVTSLMIRADLTIGLTLYSLAHTNARLSANQLGRRYLSLPGYSVELLQNEAIFCDYRSVCEHVQDYAYKLSQCTRAVVTTEKGTYLTMGLSGRFGNCCPGFVDNLYLLGSPPDVEANIAPLETDSEGIIVVDGSITHKELGILTEPVILTITKGKISNLYSDNSDFMRRTQQIFQSQNNEKALCLAELGIGFNNKAELCGNMLVDEGAYGCVHFGFGANHTIQGKNEINFHIDCIVTYPTLILDGLTVIKEGILI